MRRAFFRNAGTLLWGALRCAFSESAKFERALLEVLIGHELSEEEIVIEVIASGYNVPENAIDVTLLRLLESGLIESRWGGFGEFHVARSGRKYYRLTAEGVERVSRV